MTSHMAVFAPTIAGYIDENYHTPIVNVGLHWHFVDVIWFFLYDIFYIPGAHLK